MLGIDRGFVERYGVVRAINALRNQDYSYIDLSGAKLGLAELNTLKHNLQKCPHIFKVVLDNCEIDDLGCEALFDILTEIPTLLHLSLRNNQITDVGLNVICAGLHKNKTLLELFLSGNTQVTYIGMIAVGEVLLGNPSICTLGFTNIPRRENCLFSQEAIQDNFAMLFLFTGNKDEEELLGDITTVRQELFIALSNLLAKNDFETLKACFKDYSQCLKHGGYNAIKYYLVLDEEILNEEDACKRLSPAEADDKLYKLQAMVDEYEQSKNLQPKKRRNEAHPDDGQPQDAGPVSKKHQRIVLDKRKAGTAQIKR